MINLLADDRKDQIRAARTNVIMVRYIVIITLAIVFLLGSLYVSYTILQNTKANADAIIQTNDTKADVYSDTKAQVDTLGVKLNDSRAILDHEVHYSKVLTRLGQAMPVDATLDSLTLSTENFNGTPFDLIVYVKTNDAAAGVRDSFQNSGLFSQVDLKGTDAANGIPGYPIAVTLSVSFNPAGSF